MHPLAPPSRAGGGAALSLYLIRKERIIFTLSDTEPAVAVIMAVPIDFADTVPSEETEIILESVLLHLMVGLSWEGEIQ